MKGNRKFKRKGKQPNTSPRNQRSDRSDRDFREDRSEARNDVSWYSRNPNLLIAAGSFPYPNRPGMTVPLSQYSIGTPTPKRYDYVIPGAMVLHWIPSVGRSNTATDPASILGKEMYSRVRQVYSGALEADAPDFVMYTMALDSVFAYIAWLKRVYRTINAWSPENYFTPDGLLVAYGFTQAEVTNLRTNKTKLWQCINDLVLQSHKFTVPASMDVFNRHYWMSDNVYTDAQSINSQFYLFNPQALFQYSELAMPNGDMAAGLKMVATPTYVTRTTSLTVDDLYQYGVGLIQALVAWDDAYTINGYLRRAFEGDSVFSVAEIASTEVLTPVYEPEVLMQIENSRSIDGLAYTTDYSAFNVTQDVTTNAVISNPKIAKTVGANHSELGLFSIPPTLSVRSDTPTVADSVIASRLQASLKITGSVPSGAGKITFLIDAGTEIPLRWTIGSAGASGVFSSFASYPQYNYMYFSKLSDLQTGLTVPLANLAAASAFDWQPLSFNLLYIDEGSVVTTQTATFGDIHNFTTIQPEALENLHRICLYSEFNSFGLI